MKLLSYTHSSSSVSSSSSLSSSTSTSTASFDANICTSKSATAGCLAGILRRILCSRSLPTHPSDHITEPSSSLECHKHPETESKHAFEDKGMPTLVARLMGLESVPSVTPISSITRSRSMNSLEFSASSEKRHRRVKSTISLREMPASLEIENEEFFVLSFASASEGKEKRSRRRNCEKGYKDLKQRREEKCRNKNSKPKFTEQNYEGNQEMNEKNLCRRISGKPDSTCDPLKDSSEKLCFCSEILECSTPTQQNEAPDGATLRNKKKKAKSVELECSSEDSSPVSVLDFDQFIISELDANLVESNSRRKLSPEPPNYDSCQSRRNDNNLMSTLDDRRTKKSEGKCVGRRRKHCHSHVTYLDICDQICKITDAEVAESDWLSKMHSLNHEDFEEICADFELQILEQSLDELAHQLIGLPL